MSDIATLGLALDSRPIVAGTKALDGFTAAAKPAQAATTALEKAVADVGKATSALGGKLKPTNDVLTAVTKNAGLSSNGLLNLSRQFQDVFVSLQGGQSPLTVIAQQGSQIYDVFASSKTATVGGALKQIGSGIASVLTPARLLVGGVLAIGAAGLYTANALGKSALAAADLAKVSGTNIGSVRGFQTAANYKGIGDDESSKAMAQFARNVYDAKNNMGGLAEVFRANNMSAKDFNGYLDGASELIRRAKGDTQLQFQLLQSMGLPATEKWVKLLEQGGAALRSAINANQGNPGAEDKLAKAAQRFDDAWNKATTNTSNYVKSWALSAWDALDRLIDKASNGAGAFTRALTGQPEPSPSRPRVLITGGSIDAKPVDPAAVQRALALEQQRLGLLGQVATINETVRLQELAIQQARASGVSVSTAEAKRILDNARANALGTTQIRAQADAYALETSTLGLSTGNALAYAAVQQRINEETRKGNVLKPEQIAALRTEATALGEAASRAENMRFGYDSLTNSGQTFLSTLRNSGTVWDAFKAAGVSALDAVSQKLMKIATDNLWTSAFGGSSGSGILGSLFGGGSSAAPNSVMVGDYAMPKFASGTNSAPGGLAMINERGGEIVNLPSGAQVIPHDVSMAMANRIRLPAAPQFQSAPASNVSVPINISIDATGADAAGLARVQQQLAQLNAELPARAVAALKKARRGRDF
ncbi:phage tail length tape measure family protein [Tardiphaga sp. 215_C5_N2_1]|uniref:phage tail length tape measure family protein n=1 Tax=Tardiphaga sp. 215_C5_N2_1 TaxID=3240774 RepID=UPI003F8893BC